MKIITSEKAIIKSWCDDIEPGALQQAKNLANLPFVYKQVCLMPDTHQGYGMPIGGVVGVENVIIPNAVGVDIGCGMLAVKTSLKEIQYNDIIRVLEKIRRYIPVGFNHHRDIQSMDDMPQITGNVAKKMPIVARELNKARFQVGTLGGGNHFIELQTDGNNIWFMIHSGSRNIGKQVADHYNREAKRLNQKLSKFPTNDLAYLPLEDNIAQKYINEMNYCLQFALANRKLMAKRVSEILYDVTSCTFSKEINIHHNYAAFETHFKKQLVVHRKGATSAKLGEKGIIPGSQGTPSYIVEGKGNPESLNSCSHGAGRKLGRKQAQRELNLQEEQRKLEKKGIIHSIRGRKSLDEASGAYKDIDVVMSEQSDLVRIVTKLEPLAVVKG